MSKLSRRNVRTWPSDILCSELVEVLEKSRIHGGVPMIAVIEAISETEAVLSCETTMRRGAAIQVNGSSWSFRARVAGCRKDVGLRRHAVLVRFADPFRWGAGGFCPEHMVDLRSVFGQDAASQTPPQATAPRVFAAGQSFPQ
jgi:hypothetical protein